MESYVKHYRFTFITKKKVLIINSGKNTFIDYSNKYKNLKVINIDSGIFRTFIFNYLKSEVVFLSITDLNNSFLWKSKFVKKYVYVFHSITSTHMCYTEKSFDNYDCLLCTGSHQFTEIREREKIKNLPNKQLVKYFHNRISMMNDYDQNSKKTFDNKKIIICSSWGDGSIAENLNKDFIILLLKMNYEVFLQFHHMQLDRKDKILIDYISLDKNYKNFSFSFNYIDIPKLHNFVTMISDWSGAATEFALGFNRRVLFIDFAKKIRNKNYKILNFDLIEVFIRSEIGLLLNTTDLENLGQIMKDLINKQNTSNNKKKLSLIKKKYLFEKQKNKYLINEIFN